MAKRRVLYFCHNHPAVRPGGAEAYAYELYLAMRASEEFEPFFVASGGPPLAATGRIHDGTYFGPASGNDDHQYFLYSDGYEYDWLYGSIRGKDFYTKHVDGFLAAIQPDIVHFQHTLRLGYDLIRQVRTSLPNAPILYTLHEFLPICHRAGQMSRREDDALCMEASPRRCHECFPEVDPQTFFMRKRFVQSHLSLVDRFIAPSNFLRDRYSDWGIPADKILSEEYGRLPASGTPDVGEEDLPRTRFGFFGQLTPFKGINVLLEAMRLLGSTQLESGGSSRPGTGARADVRVSRPGLWVHGANLELQPGSFQNRFNALLDSTCDSVTLVGQYDHSDLPRLMASIDWVVVPSIWWENSPLVIQEAFAHGRPVICSDIGGMAEKVAHGVNGLHFRAGDPVSLARTLREVVETPGLWERLRQGIPAVHSMDHHVATLSRVYRQLLDQRTREAVVDAG